MTDSRRVFATCAAVWLLAALAAFWMGLSDLPCPRGVDDAFYKSPAAELVQTGRLTQPAVIGYLPRADEVFAAYPPLYQLAVAGWFAVFGFSTTSSVAFGHAIHLLNMAAIMVLVAASLRSVPLSPGLRAFAMAAPGIVFFGILRFFDRQEELAVLLGFVETTLFLQGRLGDIRGAAVTGLLVGLSATMSPWTGAVLGGIVVVREVIAWSRATQTASLAGRIVAFLLISVLPLATWVVWLESAHPGSLVEVFLYHLRISEARTIFTAPRKALESLLHAPYALPALLLTLAFFPRLLAGAARRSMPTGMLALFLGAATALAFVIVTRANSYNYIWLCLFLLIPCFGYLAGCLLAEAKPGERIFPLVMITLCVLVGLRDPVSLSLVARDLPADERAESIFARLEARIPAGAPVATTSRYWYVFQGRNPWRVTAIYPHLDAEHRRTWADWIVIPADHLTEEDVKVLAEGFELVERVPSHYEMFAPSFTLEDRTWAYDLYRRREQK
jgi:hypothetical protein